MSLSKNWSQQGQAVPPVYRLQRMFFAASIVLGTAAILVAASTNPPYYGSQQGIASAVATNATDSDLMDQTHLVAQLIAAYLLPLGFLPMALYVGQDSLYYDIARWGSNPQFVDLAQRWNTDGIMAFYGMMFGLGTVFGPTLMGIALWRSRAIPVWAAICLTLSRLPVFLFSFVPYHVETAIVIGGTVLLFTGSIPTALAILKGSGEEAAIESRKGSSHGSS